MNIFYALRRNFSQLSRTLKFTQRRVKQEIEFKQEKLQENKLYDGMNSANVNDVTKKPDNSFYPIQHTPLLSNEDTYIVPYKKKAKNLTPYNFVPPELWQFNPPAPDTPDNSKQIDVCIIGPPNSGKSLIFNKIIGSNVSAVSSKYNTTIDKVEGINTDQADRTQIVIVDTPGAIKATRGLNSRKILTKSWSVIPSCDKVLFVVDAVKKLDNVTKEAVKRFLRLKVEPHQLRMMNKLKTVDNKSTMTLEELAEFGKQCLEEAKEYESKNISSVLVLNKMDLVTNKRRIRELQEELEDIGTFDKVFHISALTGYGVEGLIKYLKDEAYRRPWKYHSSVKSTSTEAEKCQEILRQNIYNRFYYEIPYETGVKLTSWVPKSNGELDIVFNLEVRNKNIIGVVIGERGRIIKEIREECERELTIFYQRPVKVNIFVNHRNNKSVEESNANDGTNYLHNE